VTGRHWRMHQEQRIAVGHQHNTLTDSQQHNQATTVPLTVLYYEITHFGRRAFSSAAPQIWNHISAAIKVSPSLD